MADDATASGNDPAQVTVLLRRMRSGDDAARSEMVQVVYEELRRVARGLMRRDDGHTLQPTALVHEAWLKIQRAMDNGAEVEDRRHFFAVASRAMRQILVNHARDRSAQKRGGGAARVPLDDCLDEFEARAGDVSVLDELLQRLAATHARPAQIVELRVFGGMSVDEVAAGLDLTPSQVRVDWRFARAWLQKAMPGLGD
ncbi:MAG: ECF-type sigma factor [Planctomycetota bacterium]